jgi:putative restriction endonuclease
VFEKETAALPKATEAERLVVQRVGQDVFRRGLLDYWEGRCAITGLAVPELSTARASREACSRDRSCGCSMAGALATPHELQPIAEGCGDLRERLQCWVCL